MQELVEISKYAGMREDLIQAGGGNSSMKLNEREMLIKASGYQMADIQEGSGYSKVDYAMLNRFFAETPLAQITLDDEGTLISQCTLEGKRPSIETFLHSITDRITLHTHPMVVNCLATGEMSQLKALFPDALFVDYATPGIELAKAYFTAFQKSGKTACPLIFLKNHGMVVSGQTAQEVIAATEEVVCTLEKALQLNLGKHHVCTEIYNAYPHIGNDIIVLLNHQELKTLLAAGKRFTYDFCPDCVVYGGKRLLELTNAQPMAQQIVKHEEQFGAPIVMQYHGELYVRASSVKKAKEIESVLAFAAGVLLSGQPVELLSEENVNRILNLDSEKYRQTLK